MQATVTITSVAVVTTKSLFCMCNCAVDSDIGTGHLSPVLCHTSLGIDWIIKSQENVPLRDKLKQPSRSPDNESAPH